MIVLSGGEKGGTGKSTIATTLAAMAQSRGRDVLLVDADVQGTSTIWAEERAARGHEPKVPCVPKVGRSFLSDVRDLATRYEVLVVDAGGRDSKELRAALVACDVFLTPVQPSHADAWTLERLEEMLSEVQHIKGDFRASVVLSRAMTNPMIPETQETIELVQEYELLDWSGVALYERMAYRRALGLGLAPGEMGADTDAKAKNETEELYRYVFEGQ